MALLGPTSVVAPPLNNGIKNVITPPSPPVGYTLAQYRIYNFDGGPLIFFTALNTNTFNILGYSLFNGTPYTLPVTINGYYLVSANVWWAQANISSNQTNIQIRKNGGGAGIVQTSLINITGNS
jgi:hypothetical protein